MKLRFLGQAYSTSNNQIETIASKDTACFRGKTYTPSRPIPTVNSPSSTKKYRGVVYSI
jgi:hypothetical protein